MLTNEARVLIIEFDEARQAKLSDVVTQGGGIVTGVLMEYEAVTEVLEDTTFPANVADTNVVLLGTLSGTNSNLSGDDVFRQGYQSGKLHGADQNPSIGVLGVGFTLYPTTNQSAPTAGNLSFYDERDREKAWSDMVATQPAEPHVPESGVITRMLWSDDLGSNIIEALGEEQSALTLLHSERTEKVVHVSSKGLRTWETLVDSTPIPSEPNERSIVDMRAIYREMDQPLWPEADLSTTVLSHIGAVVATSTTEVILLNHGWVRIAKSGTVPRETYDHHGNAARISLERISELPSEYWKDVAVDPRLLIE